MHPIAAEVHRLFNQCGGNRYIGEDVTQLEHALQCATAAERDRGTPAEIVAALLHDIGHLLHDLPEDCASRGIDDCHERLGGRWLASRFIPAVTEPVRLHVAAKRYLCAIERDYLARLSPASSLSLQLQGGPMNPDEIAAFEQQPYAAAAVRLRRWDDEAKIVGWATPTLDHFTKLIPEVASDWRSNSAIP